MSKTLLTTLGEISNIRTGKLDANAQSNNGAYHFFTCGEENLTIDNYAFDTEAVILAGNGNFSVKYFKGKFNAYQRTYVIEPNGVDGRWLFYLVLHHISKITGGARGSTIKYLRLGDIANCEVTIVPLSEQHLIVAKIEELFSELDHGIESLKKAREQLKVYRQAVLKHAFEGKLTAKWREENKDKFEPPEQFLARVQQEREANYRLKLNDWKAAFKVWEKGPNEGNKPAKPRSLKPVTNLSKEVESVLPKLPYGWFWGKLGLMTCGVDYGSAAKSAESGLIPVVRMGNLQNGMVDWSDLVFTSDENEIEKYSLRPGDVLFNRTNSPELVGKTALYNGKRPALFAGYLIRVNHIESIVDGRFLNLYLNSPIAKQYGNTVKTDGVNQSNINGEKLQGYPFPYCSLIEQVEIVNFVEEKLISTEKSLQDINSELIRAERLRQSILKKAFSGQLTSQSP